MLARLSHLLLFAASCILAYGECDQSALAKQTQALKPADIAGITKNAESGDVAAQYLLGTVLLWGQFAPRNEPAGLNWIQRAAKSGYPEAEFSLGDLYQHGRVVEYDRNEASLWYQRAAEQGDCRAQYAIGREYLRRKQPDYQSALQWLQSSAEQGYRPAQTDLGKLYESGDGVPHNYALAAEWYQRAHRRCNTTPPPNPPFTPPAPYPQPLPKGWFWYGTEKLWTGLDVAGNWDGVQTEKGYRNKFAWFRRGYDVHTEPKPALTISGRRLDGEAASFSFSDAANNFGGSSGPAGMMSAFEIPTPGCWEITGDYHGDTLRFVVWVEP